MSENLELFKFARLYLGRENWEYLKKTSEAELSLFQKASVDLAQSYFVYGSRDLLYKFKSFYLTRCLKNRPLYMQCYVDTYASELSSDSKDDYGLNVDKDLIFLYIHEHSISTIGKSEAWLTETILNKIASRNRDGLVTIILSEIKVPSFGSSSELKVINLLGAEIAEAKTEALKDINSNSTGNSSAGAIY